MTEDEPSQVEDAPASAPETPTSPPVETRPAFDFSGLRGFQQLEPASPEDPEAWQSELVKELVARAERFVQSVDSSLLLASDGVIRWLGDPVGRLVAGEEVLKPRAVLLADDALPSENREAVERRLSLWIEAHIHKILGPLQTLAAPPEGSADAVKEVADKLIASLGVLNREDVRRQVNALDQTARGALRKLGVRFGAHYVFLPALLKPAARALCLQLWGLKHGGESDADKLMSYAAAGRTSFPVDGVLSANAYRIAGFRLCGERVVRVDIVERLTDLIRAAIPDLMRQGGGAPAAGFIITQQMTSLTGCAGDAFASILRSLGFESHQVKKSEHQATLRKHESKAKAAPATQASEAVAEAEGTVAEAPEDAVAVADSQAEGTEADADVLAETVDAAPEAQADEAEADEAPVEAEEASAEVEPIDTEADAASLAAEGPPTAAASESIEAEAPAAEGEAVAETAAEEAVASEAQAAAEGEPSGSEAEASASIAEEDPVIEIWRPAPRRTHKPQRHHQRALPPEGTGRIVWRAKEPKPAPPARQTPAPQAEGAAAADAAAEPAGRQRHGHGQGRGDFRGDRRPSFKDQKREDRRDDRPQADRPPRREPRPVVADPDSPFAKLAALRPLLERRDKRP